jgi:hypothetical protein
MTRIGWHREGAGPVEGRPGPAPPVFSGRGGQGAEAYEKRYKEQRLNYLRTNAKQMGYEMKPIPVT